MAKAQAKARNKPEPVIYIRISSANAMPEASGYPLASTGKGGKGNGSDASKGRGKGKGKVRSKSNEKGGSSEAKQLALCHGYADYHNMQEEQHRSQTVMIDSIDRLTRDPNDQRLPAHQGCKISSPAPLPPLPVPDAAPATHVP